MHICNLLPYKENSIIRDREHKFLILTLLKILSTEAVNSIESFLKNNFESFDAQIGETACQIRAHKIMMLDLNKQTKKKNENLKFLRLYRYHANVLMTEYESKNKNTPNYTFDLDGKETVEQFLNRLKINIFLEEDLIFIITSFILCKFCKRDKRSIPTSVDFQLIKNSYSLSSTSAKNFVEHLQMINSSLSCKHILYLASNLYSEDVYNFISQQLLIGDRGRYVLPCFMLTKVIMDTIIRNEQPIALVVSDILNNEEVIFFKVKNGKFYKTHFFQLKQKSIMTFRGITTQNLGKNNSFTFNIDPYDIILSNMATHPQFTGEKLSKFRDTPFFYLAQNLTENVLSYIVYFEVMRENAINKGMSIQNSSVFFIEHILCQNVNNLQTKERIQVSNEEKGRAINFNIEGLAMLA